MFNQPQQTNGRTREFALSVVLALILSAALSALMSVLRYVPVPRPAPAVASNGTSKPRLPESNRKSGDAALAAATPATQPSAPVAITPPPVTAHDAAKPIAPALEGVAKAARQVPLSARRDCWAAITPEKFAQCSRLAAEQDYMAMAAMETQNEIVEIAEGERLVKAVELHHPSLVAVRRKGQSEAFWLPRELVSD